MPPKGLVGLDGFIIADPGLKRNKIFILLRSLCSTVCSLSGRALLPQSQRYLFRAVFPLAYGYQNRQRKW